MGQDITWEQKARVSALRAACASPYVLVETVGVSADGVDITDTAADDSRMTQRIIERAEEFLDWLKTAGTAFEVRMKERGTDGPSQLYSVENSYEEALNVARNLDSPRVQYWAEIKS
jgi:tRNA(Ser,Leu) C12 N-acetylase TAN1